MELTLASLCRGECLMVFCIEERIGKVECVLAVIAWNLNLCIFCIEINVGSDNICGLIFLANIVVLEPSTSLVSLTCAFY